MWLFLSESFLSIVSPSTNSDTLLVRARRRGDIEKVFPNARVERTVGRDYLYRATISRSDVAKAVAAQVSGLGYPNFKNSILDHKLHDAAASVWSTMARLQEIPPYGQGRVR